MDIQKMLEKAKEIKDQYEEKQQEINKKKFEGNSYDSKVSICLKGNGSMKKCNINQELINEGNIKNIENLVIEAFKNAKSNLDSNAQPNFTNGIDQDLLKQFGLKI